MADGPHWADIASAIGTCSIGAVAIFLSWRAYALEQKRLRHELFSERKKLYDLMKLHLDKIHKFPEEKTEGFHLSNLDSIEDLAFQSPGLFSKKVVSDLMKMNEIINLSLIMHEEHPVLRKRHLVQLRFLSFDVKNQMAREFTYNPTIKERISSKYVQLMRKYRNWRSKIIRERSRGMVAARRQRK